MPLFKWTQSLIMGKPFKVELEKLAGTIKWAEQQDVTALRSFFSLNKCWYPLDLYRKWWFI